MKKTSSIHSFIFAIIGTVGVFFLLYYIFNSGLIPSLSEYKEKVTKNNSKSINTENTNTNGIVITDNNYEKREIIAPLAKINALYADSEEKKELGLSNREQIASDQGMLFAFDTIGVYNFWMKDMKFPLDIVWIDENKKVLGITADIQPESYPSIFISPESTKYVLEINAKNAEKFGIATGTILKF